MSAAARSLGLTQAAVSQQVAKLEKEIGVQLVDRSVRPPRLTPAGTSLRERGQRLITDLDDMRHHLERFRNDSLPELKIGIVESLAPILLPRIIPGLRQMVSNLSISAGMVPLVPQFVRGDLDIIITSERLDEIDPLEVRPLIREPFVVVTPHGTEQPQQPYDLALLSRELPMIRYLRRRRMAELIERHLERHNVEIASGLSLDSTFPILDMVRQGLGWTITTPLGIVSAGIPKEEIVVSPVPGYAMSRRIDVVAPKERLTVFPDRIAADCLAVLESWAVPRVLEYAPFVKGQIRLGPD